MNLGQKYFMPIVFVLFMSGCVYSVHINFFFHCHSLLLFVIVIGILAESVLIQNSTKNDVTTLSDHNLQSFQMWIFMLIWSLLFYSILFWCWCWCWCCCCCLVRGVYVIHFEPFIIYSMGLQQFVTKLLNTFHCFTTIEQHIDCYMVRLWVSVWQFNRLS